MPPSVKISYAALVQMLCASVEPFKKECLGMLFGSLPTKAGNQFVVAFVQLFACVRRKGFTEISTNAKSWQRLENFISCIPGPSGYLGDFHSHNEWGAAEPSGEMSKCDITTMRKEKSALDIIITISSCRKNPRLWAAEEDGSLRGSFGSKQKMYNFTVNAYAMCPDTEPDGEQNPKPQKIKIIAPEFIRTFNSALNRRQK